VVWLVALAVQLSAATLEEPEELDRRRNRPMSFTKATGEDTRRQALDLASALSAATSEVWIAHDASKSPAEYSAWPIARVSPVMSVRLCPSLSLRWPTTWNGKPQRLEISGGWPRTAAGEMRQVWERGKGRFVTASITVDAAREATAIAGEITRRLLPVYLPAFEQAAAECRQADADVDLTNQTADTLFASLGDRAGHRRMANGVRLSKLYPKDCYVRGVEARGLEITFDGFTVPLKLAIKVLALLRKPAVAQASAEEEEGAPR
jgi:hypothetical protein